MKTTKKYAYWKTIVWRMVRVGLAAAIAIFIDSYLPLLADGKLPERKMIGALVAGALGASFKMLRDTLGNDTKNSIVDKLPL